MESAISLVLLKCAVLNNEIKNLTSAIETLEKQKAQKVDRKTTLLKQLEIQNDICVELLKLKKINSLVSNNVSNN